MKKVSKIPTLLAIIILGLGIFSGVILINNRQIFKLGASPEITPKDVRITNINDKSFAVSWTTDSKTSGYVVWGTSKSSIGKVAQDVTQSPSSTHWVLVRNLIPSKSYFIKIISNGKRFDNNGTPWQTRTASSIPSKEPNVISGTVVNQEATPVKDALVYVSVAGGTPLSTTTSEDGGWLIPISMARTQTLDSYVEISQTTLIEISVQAGSAGIASAQIYPNAARPAPAISLGKIHNFKNIKLDKDGQVPDASINLPDESNGSSGFLLDEEEEIVEAANVTLENIDEGEVIDNSSPFFEGQGPVGSTITITVESDPTSELIEIDEEGNWSWNLPTALENGEHKITIQWEDAKGIIKILTRSFVVAAAGVESPTPTPTLTPTATSTPTPTITATSTATPIPTVTDTNLPAAGVLTPTILLITMSLTSIAFGGLVFSFYFEKPKKL